MRSGFLRYLFVLVFCVSATSWSQTTEPPNGGDFSDVTKPVTKVPRDVIIVKGAWASASDSVTPVPETGKIVNNVYNNEYFGLSYPLPQDWFQKFTGPPPSDSGRYVLSQIVPSDTYKGPTRGSILITADDMFFTPLPVANALEVIHFSREHLQSVYEVELPPEETRIGGRTFTFFAYWSPAAELHWYVLATQIRCHTVEFVMTSRDTKLLANLVLEMNKIRLPEEAGSTAGKGGGDVPVCIKDYAQGENVFERVDPVLTERRFNSIPVRIIIDKEGKVKHIHFLSAFPEQEKTISDALKQWKFRPYLKDGQPVEVETGIIFGRAPRPVMAPQQSPASE